MIPGIVAGNHGNDADTDPDFASVEILLHFDGANGSKTFTDEIGSTAWSENVATAEISTAEGKFDQSLYCDVNGKITADSPGSITSIGTGDFTAECWFLLPANSASQNYREIFTGAFGGKFLRIIFGNVGFAGALLCSVDGNTLATNYGSLDNRQAVLDDGTWRHIALVRSSGSVSLYLGGSILTLRNNNNTGPDVTSFADSSDINSFSSFAIGAGFDGYIDDFRLTSVARYTSNFTPPTAPFPDSA